MVLAVRKVSDVFPSMITVGRTTNNDVLVGDVQVSKFHASFRVDGERIEIADHGSRNGTWVAGARLAANAPSRPVRYGETIRFGTVEFDLVDAAECWDRIRRPRR
jgi:pSer/pThr/pTyr-binding forkhead associated (FHA) protein